MASNRRDGDGSDQRVAEIANRHGLSILRLLALSLVIVGFIGTIIDDRNPFDPGSLWTVVFGLGVVVALLAVYYGLYQHKIEGETE